jgi:uncharacterized protein (DUF1501 family)
VDGGKIFGSFPSLSPGSGQDANNRGTLIPTTAVAQYGATLAQWFGVHPETLPTIFPNIKNFPAASLSFLR